jgi:hypothetical protein
VRFQTIPNIFSFYTFIKMCVVHVKLLKYTGDTRITATHSLIVERILGVTHKYPLVRNRG